MMRSADANPGKPDMARFAGDELVQRRVRVKPSDVVLVKGLCEASEGLCAMFADRGGDLVLAAPRTRARELDEFVRDLEIDFRAVVEA
jgi:DNA-binding transcriptional MocR family regulator